MTNLSVGTETSGIPKTKGLFGQMKILNIEEKYDIVYTQCVNKGRIHGKKRYDKNIAGKYWNE